MDDDYGHESSGSRYIFSLIALALFWSMIIAAVWAMWTVRSGAQVTQTMCALGIGALCLLGFIEDVELPVVLRHRPVPHRGLRRAELPRDPRRRAAPARDAQGRLPVRQELARARDAHVLPPHHRLAPLPLVRVLHRRPALPLPEQRRAHRLPAARQQEHGVHHGDPHVPVLRAGPAQHDGRDDRGHARRVVVPVLRARRRPPRRQAPRATARRATRTAARGPTRSRPSATARL